MRIVVHRLASKALIETSTAGQRGCGREVGNPEVIHFIRCSDFPQTGSLRFSRDLLATTLPLLPRRLQLPIPLGLDLLLVPGEHFLRRDVAGGAGQADVIVVLDVAIHQTPRIFRGKMI